MDKLQTQIKRLPMRPGIYQFLDKTGRILYIGKSGNIKKRVSSYFSKKLVTSPAKHALIKKIAKIKHEVTDSEIEALLLEANLIKKHRPEYNVILKDDKSYAYLKITLEDEWPTVSLSREIEPGAKYYGPYTTGYALKETLKTLHRFFPYRMCKMRPSTSHSARAQAEGSGSSTEVCLYGRLGTCPCNGMIGNRDYKRMIKDLMGLLEGRKKKVLMRLKKELRTSNDPNKQERVNMQILNLEKVLAHKQILGLEDKIEIDLGELAKELGLKKLPERIEGYDISNIYGQEATGSMVVFMNGESDKSRYRKFKIKTVKGISDTGMLKEVLERRFKRRPSAGSGSSNWSLPNLIIIDGGRGQLNAALKVLKSYKLKIPVISLAKRLEEVYTKDRLRPLVLKRNSPALHLIQRVRDEAHRFALTYHKLLRKKKLIK